MRKVCFGLVFVLTAALSAAAGGPGPDPAAPGSSALSSSAAAPISYRLGSGDLVSLSVLELPEAALSAAPIGLDGTLAVPFLGHMTATGLTAAEFEAKLTEGFRSIVHEPNVSVSLAEMNSQSVSILGAIKAPGFYPLAGRRSLLDVLTAAGGLREDAGYYVRVSRPIASSGPIPGFDGRDPSGQFSVADISLESLIQGIDPAVNIQLRPDDVVAVPRGKMVYILGAVSRPGGYVLNERKDISILEVLALAGGLTEAAAKQDVKILRQSEAGREEVSVDLRSILKVEDPDVELISEDILLIPESGKKKALTAVSAATIGALPTVGLWSLFRAR